MRDCTIHAFNGCDCAPGQCKSATIPLGRFTKANVPEPSAEDTVTAKRRAGRVVETFLVLFYSAVAIGCGLHLDNHFKRQALINQERNVTWR